MLTCECKPSPPNARFVWDMLDLNFSSALDSAAIEHAFNLKAQSLHPERNVACVYGVQAQSFSQPNGRETPFWLSPHFRTLGWTQ